ncbi:hypothetical protein DFH07DRAFT_763603 [Mycena maculata]|uniref:Uncharacterized protein n=1 Tax=Mycena maculata TaxID=230809 RepID=A0AAD7KG94_9AGAR|nr:hypothetical protein DFH07DRAFT_763603 [Mycena maculata]
MTEPMTNFESFPKEKHSLFNCIKLHGNYESFVWISPTSRSARKFPRNSHGFPMKHKGRFVENSSILKYCLGTPTNEWEKPYTEYEHHDEGMLLQCHVRTDPLGVGACKAVVGLVSFVHGIFVKDRHIFRACAVSEIQHGTLMARRPHPIMTMTTQDSATAKDQVLILVTRARDRISPARPRPRRSHCVPLLEHKQFNKWKWFRVIKYTFCDLGFLDAWAELASSAIHLWEDEALEREEETTSGNSGGGGSMGNWSRAVDGKNPGDIKVGREGGCLKKIPRYNPGQDIGIGPPHWKEQECR